MTLFIRNVLLVDDHSIIRKGLSDIISDLGPNFKIYQASSLKEASRIFSQENIHIVSLDLALDSEYSFEVIKEFRRTKPKVKIMIFSMFPKVTYEKLLMKAGANLYIEKSMSESNIAEVIRRFFIPDAEDYSDNIVESQNDSTENELEVLSAQEKKVFSYLIKGETVKNICNLLELKQTTVTTYKKRIFEKLNITNIADLVRLSETYRKYYN